MRNISHFKDAQCAFRFLLITRYFNWNVFCDSHLKIYKTIEQLSIFGKFLLFFWLHHWSLIGIKSGGNTTKRKKKNTQPLAFNSGMLQKIISLCLKPITFCGWITKIIFLFFFFIFPETYEHDSFRWNLFVRLLKNGFHWNCFP